MKAVELQQRFPLPEPLRDEREPLGQAAPGRHDRRRHPRDRSRPRACRPASLVLEVTETVMLADADIAVARLHRSEGARRAHRDGRLRHRVLVAQLPEPASGRHPQDGPLVPRRRASTTTGSPPRSWRSATVSASRSSPRESNVAIRSTRCRASASVSARASCSGRRCRRARSTTTSSGHGESISAQFDSDAA